MKGDPDWDLIYDFSGTELAPGDLVIFKSETTTSRPMTVESIDGSLVTLVWRDNYSSGAHRMGVQRAVLQKVVARFTGGMEETPTEDPAA